jgi:hypothetical protein
MPRYAKAGTAIVGLPKNMIFVDATNNPHLMKSTTKKNKVATHYGTPAVLVANNGTKRRVKTVVKPSTVEYKPKKATKRQTSSLASTGQSMVKKAKARTDLVKKLNAVVTSNDMVNSLIDSTLANVPLRRKRGRPAGSKNKKKKV